MATTLIQFCMEEMAQIKAVNICEELGIDLQTYLRMCISRLVQENGIPFSMKLDGGSENRGVDAMKATSRIASESGISEMSLDEINTEISAARNE